MSVTSTVMAGNEAAATAAKLARVQVIAAYPITPQSPVVEQLSAWVESGLVGDRYSASRHCRFDLMARRSYTALNDG